MGISVAAKVRFPDVGAKVRIIGEPGLYLVVRLDSRRYLADVMLMGTTAKLEEGIHISLLQQIPERSSYSSMRPTSVLSNPIRGKIV